MLIELRLRLFDKRRHVFVLFHGKRLDLSGFLVQSIIDLIIKRRLFHRLVDCYFYRLRKRNGQIQVSPGCGNLGKLAVDESLPADDVVNLPGNRRFSRPVNIDIKVAGKLPAGNPESNDRTSSLNVHQDIFFPVVRRRVLFNANEVFGVVIGKPVRLVRRDGPAVETADLLAYVRRRRILTQRRPRHSLFNEILKRYDLVFRGR